MGMLLVSKSAGNDHFYLEMFEISQSWTWLALLVFQLKLAYLEPLSIKHNLISQIYN